MIFIQLVVFIPVVYFSYDDIVDDMRSKRDNDILSKAQSYEDCENIHSYTSKEKCANNIFDDINDIVGCVQLIASVKNVSSFKCDGIEYDSSWYYRLDEVEEYHFKIKQEQLEEEIELAKQDIFLTVRDNEGFIARTLELGCNEKQYHRVKVDNKYEKYYRPCNSECQYDMRLNVNKEVTEFEKMTNLDKEEACLAKKDYFQNKVDNFNQDKLSKLSSNKTLVTLKELLDYFYSYHLDRCIYSYGLNTVEINNQLRNGILDFNYLTAISNRYFIDGITIHPPNNTVSSYGCEGYGLVDYIEYEALINKYKD